MRVPLDQHAAGCRCGQLLRGSDDRYLRADVDVRQRELSQTLLLRRGLSVRRVLHRGRAGIFDDVQIVQAMLKNERVSHRAALEAEGVYH
jgi:hypothetical protein